MHLTLIYIAYALNLYIVYILIYTAYTLNLYIVYIKNIQYIFILFNIYFLTSDFIYLFGTAT